jgi:uncharacterized protein (TIGR03083 family)
MMDMDRLAHLDPVGDWSVPTRCAGWGRREVLAHLAGADAYHLAGVRDELNALLEEAGRAGVTGIDSFNAWQVTSRADRSPEEVLEEWRELNRAMRSGFRALGDEGMVASMVGPYPARLQAFHVVNHAATHADDLGVPVDLDAMGPRLAWRVTVCEFGLEEAGWPVQLERVADGHRVRLGDAEAVLTDQELVEAVNARLPEDHPLPVEIRDAMKVLA